MEVTETPSPIEEQSPNQLTLIVEQSGLDKSKSQVLLEKFTNYFAIAHEWEVKVKALVITDISQKEDMRKAREARLLLKSKRVEVENTRKQLKESSLRESQTIDSIATILKNLISPLEDELEEKEKFAEYAEARRKEKLNADRLNLLLPYNFQYNNGFHLGDMDEVMFNNLLAGCKLQFETKQANDAKAEEERIAKEKSDTEEKERLRIENAKLKEKADAQAKALKEAEAKAKEDARIARVKAENIALEVRKQSILARQEQEKKDLLAKQEQDKKDLLIKQTNDKLHERVNRCQAIGLVANKEVQAYVFRDIKISFDAIKNMEDSIFTDTVNQRKPLIDKILADDRKTIADEKAKLEAKLKKEKEERMALQDELKKKRIAEDKRIAEEEAERKEQAKAEKKARLQPDKVKIQNFANMLMELEYPDVKSEEAKTLIEFVQESITDLSNDILNQSEDL